MAALGFQPVMPESGWANFKEAAEPMKQSSLYNALVFALVLAAGLAIVAQKAHPREEGKGEARHCREVRSGQGGGVDGAELGEGGEGLPGVPGRPPPAQEKNRASGRG